MILPITQRYFLLTEQLNERPMLRTRFTTQAYLVLAAFLDLRQQGILAIDSQRFVIKDHQRWQQLPTYLAELHDRVEATGKLDHSTTALFKLLTSWNLANEIYDGVGRELQVTEQVKTVVFQNNLLPHTIYVPRVTARRALLAEVKQQLTAKQWDAAMPGVLAIFAQVGGLGWLGDTTQLTAALANTVGYAELHALTTQAQHRITQRKFELDAWLS